MAAVSRDQPIPGVAWNWRQLGGLCGIIFVVLFVIGGIVSGDTPMINDSASEARQWYIDNGDQYLVGDFIIGIAVIVFYIPFIAAFRAFLGEGEAGMPGWSLVAFLGLLFFAIGGAAASGFSGALAMGADQITDDSTVRALQYADFYSFGGLPIVFVPFYVGTAMIILRSGILWTWAAWLALALAVVSLIGAAAPIDGDPEGVLSFLGVISFIGTGVFILIVSAGMLMRRSAVSGAV
jgi:hypothetical protein